MMILEKNLWSQMIFDESGSVSIHFLSHKQQPDVHIYKVKVNGDISDEDLLTACDNQSLTDKIVRHFGGFVKDYNDFKEVHVFFN